MTLLGKAINERLGERDMEKEKIVFLRETTIGSIVSDILSFGVMCASFWFNYKFIDGNNFLDTLLFISFFTFSVGRLKEFKRLRERVE
jgi:hypothetical protein